MSQTQTVRIEYLVHFFDVKGCLGNGDDKLKTCSSTKHCSELQFILDYRFITSSCDPKHVCLHLLGLLYSRLCFR